MHTLILTPRMTDDSVALWRAAGQRGWNVERLTSWRLPEYLKSVENPVLYVEALTAPMMAEELGLELVEPPEDWLTHLPWKYAKRTIALSTLGEARKRTEKAFIKPPNDKSFAAAVYMGSELPEDFDDTKPVLISDIVDWELEFRCFILDRKVVTLSPYLRNGVLQRDAGFPATEGELCDARQFAETMLADPAIAFPKATVLDVGLIKDQGWATIEQNAAWASGMYGCDANGVLDVLVHATRRTT